MGSILKAICKCGFKSKDIEAGGGLFTGPACWAPAICLNCRKLLVRDYMAKNKKCPACGHEITFYNDPSVQTKTHESEMTENKFSWRDALLGTKTHEPEMTEDAFSWRLVDGKVFRLPNTHYLCPKCGKMTMVFVEELGCWD